MPDFEKIGYIPGIYHEEYGPYKENNCCETTVADILSATLHVIHHIDTSPLVPLAKSPGLLVEMIPSSSDSSNTPGIFHPTFIGKSPPPGLIKLKELWLEDKSPAWMLHPDIYRAAGQRHHWGSNLPLWVVRPIFKFIHIRRTMRTKLTLPDGTVTYPGVDLLPPDLHFEELGLVST
ncbi:hypothetical protein J7337_006115 [Fusarium musae]|uniref:Uncharacterized protein n=1 Tax=Fusarium musae TaxID=1042133 RepID=A0A9P8IRT0_9HYPO|nr:hypothetical protein J7337_006115 [Fusarium musae]KAG9503272.1 hypothetical protein J7337_006115 [Fusarium musae]